MTPTLPDEADAWVRAWRDRLNDSEPFADAAAEFEAAILFVVQPDERYDGDPVRMLVEVADGECVAAEAVAADADADYDYALRGPLRGLEGAPAGRTRHRRGGDGRPLRRGGRHPWR